ncbi:MAG: hypothetical protein JXA90_07570 [Planctomycetes bacterium]|nr:hypothetical protein [Planctomycetota bacterium]
MMHEETAKTFGEDAAFLRRHSDAVVLEEGDAMVAVVPRWQGRVMTSTAGGEDGPSYGWIHRDLIRSGEVRRHINAYGGEDRFWLGPEGGQFSIFFKKGDPFDLEHWQTPPLIDTEPFDVKERTPNSIALRKKAAITNYSGTTFDLEIERAVVLHGRAAAASLLGGDLPEPVKAVAYESRNTVRNVGNAGWTREGGLLSIWILAMLNHSPATTVVLPFVAGPEAELGPIVNDAYFGEVPDDRLRISGGVVFFRADGEYRSKIGIGPRRALPVLGSYDPSQRHLTIVQYDKPEGATEYVNSMWEIQEEPFAGDVVNSYNDGPPAPGQKPLGPFYELETSSPALALAPGDSYTHAHRTIHLEGPEEDLDAICRRALGVAIADVKAAFE